MLPAPNLWSVFSALLDDMSSIDTPLVMERHSTVYVRRKIRKPVLPRPSSFDRNNPAGASLLSVYKRSSKRNCSNSLDVVRIVHSCRFIILAHKTTLARLRAACTRWKKIRRINVGTGCDRGDARQRSEMRIFPLWIIVRVNAQTSDMIEERRDRRTERECGRSAACDKCKCARQRTRSLADAFSTVWRTRSVDDSRLSYCSRCGIGQAVGRSASRSVGRLVSQSVGRLVVS